jgi:hypothetical protein
VAALGTFEEAVEYGGDGRLTALFCRWPALSWRELRELRETWSEGSGSHDTSDAPDPSS